MPWVFLSPSILFSNLDTEKVEKIFAATKASGKLKEYFNGSHARL
jgi:hypothetical protein